MDASIMKHITLGFAQSVHLEEAADECRRLKFKVTNRKLTEREEAWNNAIDSCVKAIEALDPVAKAEREARRPR